jgi:hypothetical protein
MVIITENKKKTPKNEAGNRSQWDITWGDALRVFETISGHRGITFYEVGPDRNPLGNQPITGLKISGGDLFIYGTQTGYIVLGKQVKRIIRDHSESSRIEKIIMLFSPYKELEFTWTS